jgi:hypothetical protein
MAIRDANAQMRGDRNQDIADLFLCPGQKESAITRTGHGSWADLVWQLCQVFERKKPAMRETAAEERGPLY